MPSRPRLVEGQVCYVRQKTQRGSVRRRGVVTEALPKRYRVMLDGAERAEEFRANQVSLPRGPGPASSPSSLKLDSQHQRPAVVAAARAKPVPKPDPPEECDWWLRYVRTLPCCNCGRAAPSEAHHEGRKGVGQKVRDTMAVPLCTVCHRVLTDKNALPFPGSMALLGVPELRTRDASLRILQAEQERLLTAALLQLAQPARIEVLSKAVAVSRRAAS